MIQPVLLPKLANSMEDACIALWFVQEGDSVQKGQVLCDITTDKATLEIEAPADGVLRHILAKQDDLVPVGANIAIITDADDTVPDDMLTSPALASAPERPVSCPRGDGPPEKLNFMRTIIARRMAYSAQTAPHFFITTVVDMHNATEMRKALRAEKKKVNFNDMIIRAAGLAIQRFPQAGKVFTPNGYLPRSHSHIGFAVALDDDGLIVPVVRDVAERSLEEVAAEIKNLVTKARGKKMTPDDYADGVFTVSNLGMFDVDQFTAIINPGEAAILAIGKIADAPAVIGGEVVVRPQMKITLSSDHRVVDGVLAAKVNGYIKSLLEDPEKLL